MHYAALVLIPRDDPELQPDTRRAVILRVQQAMSELEGAVWDWYQIGGRWTGALDGYDPEKDEANVEQCDLCAGTGIRTDMSVSNGCNWCAGKGRRVKWPTAFADHDDWVPVESLTDKQLKRFYYVVVDGYGYFGGEEYRPWEQDKRKFKRRGRPPLAWLKEVGEGMLAVVVDCHN